MDYTQEEENEWSCAHTEKPATEVKDLPEGVYPGKLVGFKAIQKKSDGSKMFVLKYRITSGDYTGQVYDHFLGLTSGKQMLFARGQLEALGMMNPGDKVRLSDVEKIALLHIGAELEFEISKNGKFTNCKILGLVEGARPKNDDVPF